MEPLGAYADFEGGVAQLEAHLATVVANLRAAYAVDPTSGNHRTQVQIGMLSEMGTAEPQTLASLLVVAVDQLSRCTGRHIVDHVEPSVEDWR